MDEATKRYEATLVTQSGVHTMGLFDDLDKAHHWVMGRWEEITRERAAAIYDLNENRKRVFVLDPHFLLPASPNE